MNETVKLSIGDKTYELPVIEGAENEKAIDISKLRAQSGYITIDTGLKIQDQLKVRLHFLMVKKVF